MKGGTGGLSPASPLLGAAALRDVPLRLPEDPQLPSNLSIDPPRGSLPFLPLPTALLFPLGRLADKPLARSPCLNVNCGITRAKGAALPSDGICWNACTCTSDACTPLFP